METAYLVPLRSCVSLDAPATAYFRSIAREVDELLVVDGSPDEVVEHHRAALGPAARVLRPDPSIRCRNGKVQGVLTGLAATRCEHVVIADDDVRYDGAALRLVTERLGRAEAVCPQNVFDPAPWHARWDTGRILVHRAVGHDMPGTVAVRRRFVARAGGYDGDVLFENLELLRTIAAAGGRVDHALDIAVARVPPSTERFVGQRVRQAYDEFARPLLLLTWLAVLPSILHAARRVVRPARRTAGLAELAAIGGCTILLAEAGRRRAGGREVFPATAALWAPLWLLERGLCSWIALGARLRGGARYHGVRFPKAASSPRRLRRRFAEGAGR